MVVTRCSTPHCVMLRSRVCNAQLKASRVATFSMFCFVSIIAIHLIHKAVSRDTSTVHVSYTETRLRQPFCSCSTFTNGTKRKFGTVLISPPWIAQLNNIMNSTNRTANLYVWSDTGSNRRLGNQLFIYASLYGVAWRNGRIPLWPDGDSILRRYFNIAMPIDRANAIHRSTETNSVSIDEPGHSKYNNFTESLPERNVSLRGYLQSWKYFIHVEDQLRQELTFKVHVMQEARIFINSSTPPEWKGLDFIRVVIHVRRGDHATPDQQRNGWPVATAEYFNKSMSCFTNCFERVQFIVLSEDIEWCSKNILGQHVVFSRGRLPIVDMAIASLCDHAIITIGSYGIWCSWFANGVTITHKNVPIAGSPLTRNLCREDYYKPNYIGL